MNIDREDIYQPCAAGCHRNVLLDEIVERPICAVCWAELPAKERIARPECGEYNARVEAVVDALRSAGCAGTFDDGIRWFADVGDQFTDEIAPGWIAVGWCDAYLVGSLRCFAEVNDDDVVGFTEMLKAKYGIEPTIAVPDEVINIMDRRDASEVSP